MVFLPIPNSKRYLISEKGTVLDTIEEKIVRSKDNLLPDSRVKLLLKNRTDRFRSISIARLVLITHKPIEGVTLNSLWAPKLIDPSLEGIDASNLEYDFGDYFPPEPKNDKEFYSVPGELVGLEINMKGEVKLGNKYLDRKIIKGYNVVSLKNKNGTTRYIGVYRLLAITFLSRPIDYSEIVVNHKDGDPSNDNIDNLEWATYYSNMIHAHESGLVKNHKPIQVKNLESGEISNLFSIGAFSRFLGLNDRETKRLEFRMRMFKVADNYRGYSIKLKEVDVDWISIKELDKYKGNTKEVIAVNLTNNKIHEFLWFKDAVDFLSVSDYRLRRALREKEQVVIGDYLVSYLLPNITAGNSVV